MKRYVRNAAATILGVVVTGGVVVGTMTYRGEEVEVADCDAETRGVRYFAARVDADGLPILAGVSRDALEGRCQRPTPYAWTDGQSREWYIWQCICTGQTCCAAMDHAQYLGADKADLKAKAASLGNKSIDKTHLLCALDSAGCREWTGASYEPAPCRKPVADIPGARRPPESEWGPCATWAGHDG